MTLMFAINADTIIQKKNKMPLPKQVKPTLPLVPQKTLLSRREELLEYINKDGTYLPKSVLHADLDKGMLDFVKEELKVVVDGKIVPTVDRIITTQNWSQYVETALFTDLDFNPSPPFITLVRTPEVKYGTNPALQYTIPNRKQFYYASVPTWNGNVAGMDIYTIPQPVPVDIKFSLKIVCNRMRELNQLNKIVLQTFSSRQAYRFIKGQYVPIILDNISDESQMNLDARKYFVQSYDFTMLGYLIDEEEFEVKPAVARVLQITEVETRTTRKRRNRNDFNPNRFETEFNYDTSSTSVSKTIDYRSNTSILGLDNVAEYDVYINEDFFGSNIVNLQLSTNDILRIDIVKDDNTSTSTIKLENNLV